MKKSHKGLYQLSKLNNTYCYNDLNITKTVYSSNIRVTIEILNI